MNYQLFLFGVGCIGIMLTWKYMWLPTLLDATRDELFDLRDEKLKKYFASTEAGLNHPMYIKLRTLINGHLRHTESFSLWEMMFMVFNIEKNPVLDEYKTNEINNKFKTDDEILNNFIEEVRMRGAIILARYMLRSSVIAFTSFLIRKPIEFTEHLFSNSSKIYKGLFSASPNPNSKLAMEIWALN